MTETLHLTARGRVAVLALVISLLVLTQVVLSALVTGALPECRAMLDDGTVIEVVGCGGDR